MSVAASTSQIESLLSVPLQIVWSSPETNYQLPSEVHGMSFGPTVCSHLQAENLNPCIYCGAANRNAVKEAVESADVRPGNRNLGAPELLTEIQGS